MIDPTASRAAPSAASPLSGPAPTMAAGHQTAEQFEAFFISSIMENLFSGVPTDGLFGGGQAEGVYRSMLLQEYGKAAARGGGIGIGAAVQREMLRMQEATRR